MLVFGFCLNEIFNFVLGWEVLKMIDVGFDFDILNGWIVGFIDYYCIEIEDIFLNCVFF